MSRGCGLTRLLALSCVLQPLFRLRWRAAAQTARSIIWVALHVATTPLSTHVLIRFRQNFGQAEQAQLPIQRPPAMPPKRRPPRRQLRPDEQALVDKLLREAGNSAMDALRAIKAARERQGVATLHKSSAHRYVKGRTHKRGAAEARGRPGALSKADVDALDRARARFVKRANNNFRVTYNDIIYEAGLAGKAGMRLRGRSPKQGRRLPQASQQYSLGRGRRHAPIGMLSRLAEAPRLALGEKRTRVRR